MLKTPYQIRFTRALSIGLVLAVLFSCGGGGSGGSGSGSSGSPHNYTVTTLTPLTYDAGEPALNNPSGITLDDGGNLIVSDTGNGVVRKIVGTHATTLIGALTGCIGATYSTWLTSCLNRPNGVAYLGGNIYLTELGLLIAREAQANGAGGTTFELGTPSPIPPLKQLNSPFGLAVNAAGDVFIADTGNDRIMYVAHGSASTTLYAGAGQGYLNGALAGAMFNHPSALVVGANSSLYVADTGNCSIRKIYLDAGTNTWQVMTLAGSGPASCGGLVDGSGAQAKFNNPSGLAIDAGGNLYVADTNNHAIRMVTPAGLVTTIAGTGSSGAPAAAETAGTSATFNSPLGIVVDASGNIFVTDTLNNAIRKITH